LRLLRRFHLELGLDPGVKVADEAVSAALVRDSIMDILKGEQEKPGLFFALMKERGIRGWDALPEHLAGLFRMRPLSELMLEEPLDLRQGRDTMFMELFIRCLAAYRVKKKEASLIDFSDIEIFAYRALLKSPHWQNILYSFDEYTDHILVDEFQDTSALQWRILDKLTEEWRAGLGAKRDSGVVPTFFLVGDEKQSIYLFRGADVTVMRKAGLRLRDFLGAEYEFHQARDNYRSLPAIVEFTNRLFGRLMPGGPGQVDYSPFEAKREGEGKVELLLLTEPEGGRTRDKRTVEAFALAKLIKSMRKNFTVFCDGKKPAGRPCEYGDMAVLLRQRTHLAAFERAFRSDGVPFLVQKGMGFYEEPEVALLREFACFIARPEDDYSLFCLLRSPLFGMGYEALSRLCAKGRNIPLITALRASRSGKRREIAAMLDGLISSGKRLPVSRLIELLLVKTEGWRHFWEPPRHANVKKFIRMVESWESEGANLLAVRDRLLSDRGRTEVPKANVNAEGMDVVKLMTVHAAKGLQFPVVFLPSLDESITPKSPPVVIEEKIIEEKNEIAENAIGEKSASGEDIPSQGEGFIFRYEPDRGQRERLPAFEQNRSRELEEEKRLFYVAATRAMDRLVLSGFRPARGKSKGRLDYLVEAFGGGILDEEGRTDPDTLPFGICGAAELEKKCEKTAGAEFSAGRRFFSGADYAEPFEYEPAARTKDVTEDILVKTTHGRDWVLMGRLMHQVLEEISGGRLRPDGVRKRAETILKGFHFVFDRARQRFFLDTLMGDMDAMEKKGILEEIVMPRPDAFSELPFAHEKGKTLYKGRIDRLLIKDRAAFVYDYKSFPARRRELGELVEKYRFQMELYREAARSIFGVPARAFLVFTHIPEILEVGFPR
nr:UvrD-helicase domain-containing protein [Nitrospiraceae bacterium]